MRKVLNKYRDQIPDNAVSIMRPGPFGNPFKIGRDGTRDEVLLKYTYYLDRKLEKDETFRKAVKGLLGKPLLCCCSPAPCHGDILYDRILKLNGQG